MQQDHKCSVALADWCMPPVLHCTNTALKSETTKGRFINSRNVCVNSDSTDLLAKSILSFLHLDEGDISVIFYFITIVISTNSHKAKTHTHLVFREFGVSGLTHCTDDTFHFSGVEWVQVQCWPQPKARKTLKIHISSQIFCTSLLSLTLTVFMCLDFYSLNIGPLYRVTKLCPSKQPCLLFGNRKYFSNRSNFSTDGIFTTQNVCVYVGVKKDLVNVAYALFIVIMAQM